MLCSVFLASWELIGIISRQPLRYALSHLTAQKAVGYRSPYVSSSSWWPVGSSGICSVTGKARPRACCGLKSWPEFSELCDTLLNHQWACFSSTLYIYTESKGQGTGALTPEPKSLVKSTNKREPDLYFCTAYPVVLMLWKRMFSRRQVAIPIRSFDIRDRGRYDHRDTRVGILGLS